MKHEYDFSLEIAAPKKAMDRYNEVINRHATRVWADDATVPIPSDDDEVEILSTLFGLGRMVEMNVRIAWESFAIKEKCEEEASPRKYINVLKNIDKYLKNDDVHWLFKNALTITDGLVHGGFHQAYIQAEKAYEKPKLNLTQSKFIQQTIVTTKVTSESMNLDAKTGVLTTGGGHSIPHKSYVPSKEKTIPENFQAFYVAATFVPVYDVLLSAYQHAFRYRKCIYAAKENSG